jgi:hypothetical protein
VYKEYLSSLADFSSWSVCSPDPVAFILAGDMAVAYFMAHAPKGFFPSMNGGQLAILFCFVFLYFVFAGGENGVSMRNWLADGIGSSRATQAAFFTRGD